ncbi:YiiD C-terminal domain-containing protein [Alcanivorax sp. IL1]|uniref:YiiD C-terminal domain-containing protein n=1 Tax=Alcanivorax sp. IL1 TaxID=3396308 RepID=UPI0039C13326
MPPPTSFVPCHDGSGCVRRTGPRRHTTDAASGLHLRRIRRPQSGRHRPLGPNHNDKGTFFAGSQSALLTLAGWGLTTLLAQQSGHPADVVAVETSLEYKLPLDGDLQITASISEEDRERFAQRLSRRGKATLRIHAKGTDVDGKVVCLYQGLYLART